MPPFSENKKVYFNYEILEKFTAGIELLGFEVKAIRAGKMSLEGGHIIVRGGEAYLVGTRITPMQPKNVPKGYEEKRNRKLLLTKKEIMKLAEMENKKGLTIVPLSVYNIKNKLKVELGIARGKKTIDKRETIKRRETEREMRRSLKWG